MGSITIIWKVFYKASSLKKNKKTMDWHRIEKTQALGVR